MKTARTVVTAAILAIAALGCTTSARADDLAKKPWQISLGGFLLTDSVVSDQSAAGSLLVRYNFKSHGSRRQNEDGVTLLGAFARAQVAGIGIDNDISIGGLLYEHTWGFGSMYYSVGAGVLATQISNFGAQGNFSDGAFIARLGTWFDRKQSFGIELMSLEGGRVANTGISLGLTGRF